MKGEYTAERCVALLRDKKAELNASGDTRYPRRSDFTDAEVCAIKAFLGPWPRALEAAGLKPERDDEIAGRRSEKRIRAKRARTEKLKSSRQKSDSGNSEDSAGS